MEIPGARIKDLREAAHWSTSDLARACDLREEYLIQIENGHILKVHTRTYQKIADALGITLGMLLGEEEILRNAIDEEELPNPLTKLILFFVISLGLLASTSLLFGLIGSLLVLFLEKLPWL